MGYQSQRINGGVLIFLALRKFKRSINYRFRFNSFPEIPSVYSFNFQFLITGRRKKVIKERWM